MRNTRLTILIGAVVRMVLGGLTVVLGAWMGITRPRMRIAISRALLPRRAELWVGEVEFKIGLWSFFLFFPSSLYKTELCFAWGF